MKWIVIILSVVLLTLVSFAIYNKYVATVNEKSVQASKAARIERLNSMGSAGVASNATASVSNDLSNGAPSNDFTQVVGTVPSFTTDIPFDNSKQRTALMLAQQAAVAARIAACRVNCAAIHPFNKSKREACRNSCS